MLGPPRRKKKLKSVANSFAHCAHRRSCRECLRRGYFQRVRSFWFGNPSGNTARSLIRSLQNMMPTANWCSLWISVMDTMLLTLTSPTRPLVCSFYKAGAKGQYFYSPVDTDMPESSAPVWCWWISLPIILVDGQTFYISGMSGELKMRPPMEGWMAFWSKLPLRCAGCWGGVANCSSHRPLPRWQNILLRGSCWECRSLCLDDSTFTPNGMHLRKWDVLDSYFRRMGEYVMKKHTKPGKASGGGVFMELPDGQFSACSPSANAQWTHGQIRLTVEQWLSCSAC